MKRAVLILLVTVAALVTGGRAHSAPARVTLLAQAQVQPARPVTVKDIARIEGPKESVRKIGQVAVATGPMPGKCSSVDLSHVKIRLQAEAKTGFELRGPSSVELTGKCIKFTPQEITNVATRYIREQLPQDSRTFDVVVDRMPREVIVASGSTSELRARLLNPTLQPGPKAVVVDVLVDQSIVASVTVALSVKATAEVLIATRAIRQNEEIGPENTTWERRDVSRVADAIVQGQADVTGWIARRGLSAGMPIRSDAVAAPFTVRLGETATLTVMCGSIRLRTTAEIKQDARLGDNVRIRPEGSLEDVQARVLGSGLVGIVR